MNVTNFSISFIAFISIEWNCLAIRRHVKRVMGVIIESMIVNEPPKCDVQHFECVAHVSECV